MDSSGKELDTPVAVFLYNRPEHAERVLGRIRDAEPPLLLVIADGPDPDNEIDEQRCEQTRSLVTDREYPFRVRTNFAPENLGLRERFSTGLDWVFNRVSEAIILEEDTVPEPSFFHFCEEMLDRFRDDERVMEITGRNQLETWERDGYDYHFSYYGGIWGWATWRDAWEEYDAEMELWSDETVRERIRDLIADDEQFRYLRRIYDRTYRGQIETWDYQWGFARHRNGALSVVPARNLISNIGFGEQSTNTKNTSSGFADKTTMNLDFPLEHPPFVAPDREYDRRFHRLRPDRWKSIRGISTVVDLFDF
jgi:glycosyltransferase involved in cell wall biosynthesis